LTVHLLGKGSFEAVWQTLSTARLNAQYLFPEHRVQNHQTPEAHPMKKMRIQIKETLLTLVIVVLMSTLVYGAQPDPTTNSDQAGGTVHQALNEAPVEHFDRTSESFAPAVKKVAPAVVRIITALRYNTPADLTSDVQGALRSYVSGEVPRVRSGIVGGGLGSGVIVTEHGYILTTGHLLAGVNEAAVTLQDGRDFNAKVIGLDAKSDIAVIKIDAHQLPTIPLADSRNVQVGDLVLAIGHPFGVGQTVTHGIVSATNRGGMGFEDSESFIQTDAPINPGNSGGALVDVTGQLIGINTAILSSSGGNLGIGFAVPSDVARRVMADLLMYGYVVRGYLGVETQDLTPGLAKEFKLQGATGVLVAAVAHNGPAEKAGLQVGDVINRFDDKDVQDSRQLKLSVAESKPGQVIPLEILRDGSARSLRVTLRNASTIDLVARTDRTVYEANPGALQGVFVGELNSELRQKLKIPHDVQGAFVFDLHAYSMAAQAGLRPGDVIQSINQHEIRNAAEASQLAQTVRDKHLLLRVWSSAGSHFIRLED
jgi:serine protease Do